MILSATIFSAAQVYWFTPAQKAHEKMLLQIPIMEARAGEVLSKMPGLAGLKQSFRKEEARLRPLQEETEKSEKQMLTEKSALQLAESLGAKLQKTAEIPQVPYVKTEYTLTQQGDYPELLASLSRFEAVSPFVKFSSLTMEKTENQVLLHAGFSVLTSPGNQDSKSLTV